MISEAIIKIVDKQNLTYDEAYRVMDEIMAGKTTPTQNAAFLAALSTKSTKAETEEEIAGCSAAMRDKAVKFDHPYQTLDIVGTGGDHSNTFNISTASSFVIAAAGIKVAKHGNRAASSRSGAADVLESLGINIDQPPRKALELLNDPGICFLFAQKYHESMKYVGPLRKELGFRTVFNILGPLTNPSKPTYQVLGVYDEYLVNPLAHVLHNLGVKKGMVVYGQDRMDEISCSAPTTVCDFEGDDFDTYTMTPPDFGVPFCSKKDLEGGSPDDNAKIIVDILHGRKSPKYNAVLLNSGAGLYAGRAVKDIRDGVELADKILEDGTALRLLEKYKVASNQ